MPPKKRKRKVVPEEERFNIMNNTQHKEKRKKLINHNTVKADKKAEKVFTSWLTQRGIHTDYWDLSVQELDDLLSKFYFEERTIEGEMYKTSSLGNLRYGLNRILHSKHYEADIVHDPQLAKSSAAFSDACKELKAAGKGKRDSYKEITAKGMYFLYNKSEKYSGTHSFFKKNPRNCQGCTDLTLHHLSIIMLRYNVNKNK